jgi:putative polyhydroxyalkanoate system protein
MPKFQVEIPHALATDDVRSRLERASHKLERDYGATCKWEGQDLVVARKGLSARVATLADKLQVDVELGLLFSAMAGPIKNGITKQLTELMEKKEA